jgi:hypothetical protein
MIANKRMKTFQIHGLSILTAVALWTGVSALAENWPAWRGPAGTGVANDKNLPQHWGTNENVRRRTPLPERGNSTPIVWGGRVYALNQGGDAFVLKASPKFQALATNSLGEATIASMAVSEGDLFVRTHKALWCFRESWK